MRHRSNLFARLALATIYIWFGLLKVFSLSAASPLVTELLHRLLPSVHPSQFLILFGVFEVLIGILFLLNKFTRLAITLFFIHMVMTALPLIILKNVTWQSHFVPTLEGQYIIKNLALIALVFSL